MRARSWRTALSVHRARAIDCVPRLAVECVRPRLMRRVLRLAVACVRPRLMRRVSLVMLVLQLEVGHRLGMGTPLVSERVLVMRLSLHREPMALRVQRFLECRRRPRIRALSCRAPRRGCLRTAVWSRLVGRR